MNGDWQEDDGLSSHEEAESRADGTQEADSGFADAPETLEKRGLIHKSIRGLSSGHKPGVTERQRCEKRVGVCAKPEPTPARGTTEPFSRAINLAIERSTVQHGDDRYKRMFDLARRLKGIQGFKPSADLLKRILCTWNDRGQHKATGRWFAQLWKQFRSALDRVKQPTGAVFAQLLDRAKAMETPACALRYGDRPGLVLLVRLGVVLNEHANGKPWPLSARQAAGAIGKSPMTAARMLATLERDGIFRLDQKGKQGPGPRPASTWRFVGKAA